MPQSGVDAAAERQALVNLLMAFAQAGYDLHERADMRRLTELLTMLEELIEQKEDRKEKLNAAVWVTVGAVISGFITGLLAIVPTWLHHK